MPLSLWRGHSVARFPGVAERLDKFQTNWQPKSSDVWILAYAKAGSHWLHEIVGMLLSNGLTTARSKEQGMVECAELEEMAELPSPRLLNNHLVYSELPESVRSSSKIIYIDRNPKSVAVSLYNQAKQTKSCRYCGTWDAFLDLFMEGHVVNGSWFDYVKEWQEVADQAPANILYFRYEWMKRNHVEGVRKIAKFLELDTSEELIQAVAKQTDFSVQKKLNENKTVGGINMYRKGTVSDWKNWFTVAQNERFDALYNNCLADFKGEPFQFE